MTDSVHILNGDELDEDLLAEALGRTGISDYVERGLDIREADVDFAAAVVDIPAGKAFVLDNSRDAMLLADARAGVQLATDGVNHVFIAYDVAQPEGERIDFHVDSDGTAPADPALKIAEIDMGAQTVNRVNDFAPINDEDAITLKGNDIDSDGDGVVDAADEAYLVQAANVSGAVPVAEDSQRLGGIPASDWLQSTGDSLTAGFTASGELANTSYLLEHELPTAGQISRLWRTNADGQNQPDFALYRDPASGDFMRGKNLNTDTHLFRFDEFGNLQFFGDRHVKLNLYQANPTLYRDLGQTENVTPSKNVRILRIDADDNADIAIDRIPQQDNVLRIVNAAQNETLFDFAEGGGFTTAGSITANGNESVVTGASIDSQTAGDTVESTRVREVIRSPNLHMPLATLEAGESVQTAPIPTGGSAVQVWVWGVLTGGGATPPDLRLEFMDGDETRIDVTTSGREEGNPDGTAIATASTPEVLFKMTNATGSELGAGFYVGYYMPGAG